MSNESQSMDLSIINSLSPVQKFSKEEERYLKALEIAERHGNRFMAQNIRAELRKLDAEPITIHPTPNSQDF